MPGGRRPPVPGGPGPAVTPMAAAPEPAAAGRRGRARPRCMTPGPHGTRRPMIFPRSRCTPRISRRVNFPPGRSPPTSLPVNSHRLRGPPQTPPPRGIARRARTPTNSLSGPLPEEDFVSSEFPAADFPSEEMPAAPARTRQAPPKPDPGRDRSDSRRRPGKGQNAPKGRSRKRDDDDWPSMEWDKLTDEQYWAQLSSDKPLATTARSSQPAREPRPAAGEARPAASRNGHARPAGGGPKPAPRPRPPGHATWPTGSQPAPSARRRPDGQRRPGARRRCRGASGSERPYRGASRDGRWSRGAKRNESRCPGAKNGVPARAGTGTGIPARDGAPARGGNRAVAGPPPAAGGGRRRAQERHTGSPPAGRHPHASGGPAQSRDADQPGQRAERDARR